MEFINLALILIGFVGLAIYLKKPKANSEDQFAEKDSRILLLEKEITEKNTTISNLQKELQIAAAKTQNFEQIKHEKTQNDERLKLVEMERNSLKNQNIAYQKAEEGRQKEVSKSIESALTLQKSLENEKVRLNDERVQEKADSLEKNPYRVLVGGRSATQ